MIRYNIEPGHGRLKVVGNFNSAELVVGCSERAAKLGANTGETVDDIELLFSIVIHDPKTARVYANSFNSIADMLEGNKEITR